MTFTRSTSLTECVRSPLVIGIPWACLLMLLGCGGGQGGQGAMQAGWRSPSGSLQGAGEVKNDHSRCDFRGRADREAVETAGPGALQPNVRRVYQIIGSGETMHKVLVCREIDTNLDGIKDMVRTYNDKGESLHEEADTDYDGRIDVWTAFSSGRIGREEVDANHDGKPDLWKYYVAGRLSRIQRDTNGDGKADQWEFYTGGKLERMGIDSDFDGQVDRWDRDQAMKLAEEAAEASHSQTHSQTQSQTQSESQGAKSPATRSSADPAPGAAPGTHPQKP